MKDLQGSEFYDNQAVFERYINHRKWVENPNELIEKPIFLELAYGIKGNVLDLGCGYGDISSELLSKGITRYTGIDSSSRMIALGKSQIKDNSVELIKSNVEDWEYGKSRYDWVISRLVFHYIADLEKTMLKIYQGLKENGKLLFSVEHPVITSSINLPRNEGKKQDWRVDQYFELGVRVQEWMGNRVIKYHRSIEDYWRMVKLAGFIIEGIKEGCPQEAYFLTREEYERRKRIPLFLYYQGG